MGGTTPVYGIRYPDNNTPARDLGKELGDMGRDLEAALKQAGGAGPVDTGWVNMTFDPAIKAGPAVRRIGSQCYSRGVFQFAANGTITSAWTTLGQLPTGFRPLAQTAMGSASSLPYVFQLMILTDGSVQVRTFEVGGAPFTSSSSFSIVGSWLSS